MDDENEPTLTATAAFSAFAGVAETELAPSGQGEPKAVPPAAITEAALPEGFLGGGEQ